ALRDDAQRPRPAVGNFEREARALFRRTDEDAHKDLRARRCARRASVDELHDLGRGSDGEVERERDLLRDLGERDAAARNERPGRADVEKVELLRKRGRREDAGLADIGRADEDDVRADASIVNRARAPTPTALAADFAALRVRGD